MKNRIFFALLAIVCILCACDKNNNDVTSPHEGQKVRLTVKFDNDIYANGARRITGAKPKEESVAFSWIWSTAKKDIIIIEPVDNSDPAQRKTFTMVGEPSGSSATFEGEMPSNWSEGDPVHVIAGDVEHLWPTSTPLIDNKGGIPDNGMRFETITSDLDNIELEAVWGAFFIPIGPQIIWEGQTELVEQESIFKFYTKSVQISGNVDGESVSYFYKLDKILTVVWDGGAVQHEFLLLYVVKPGIYTDLSITINIDKNQCNNGVYQPRDDNPDSFTFTYSVGSQEVLPNKYVKTHNATCEIKYIDAE